MRVQFKRFVYKTPIWFTNRPLRDTEPERVVAPIAVLAVLGMDEVPVCRGHAISPFFRIMPTSFSYSLASSTLRTAFRNGTSSPRVVHRRLGDALDRLAAAYLQPHGVLVSEVDAAEPLQLLEQHLVEAPQVVLLGVCHIPSDHVRGRCTARGGLRCRRPRARLGFSTFRRAAGKFSTSPHTPLISSYLISSYLMDPFVRRFSNPSL